MANSLGNPLSPSTSRAATRGQIERDQDGNNVEPWILGYWNDNDKRMQYYFRWASIQVVELDIPLVLDALPVHRGLGRHEVVDDFLGNALEMVDDIEMLYMDTKFAPTPSRRWARTTVSTI